MEGNNYLVSEEFLTRLIITLKGLEVRGYDSMNALVGTVILTEAILEQGPYRMPVSEQSQMNEEIEVKASEAEE